MTRRAPEAVPERVPVPRDPEDDYTEEAASRRREFVESWSGEKLEHTGQYSFDPSVLPGNIENFTGWSITLPSLIVATVGGGTNLPTQREALEVLGCYGPGKADKLAEIVAATVLAGETSLSGAILVGDWVSSHEQYERKRPKS